MSKYPKDKENNIKILNDTMNIVHKLYKPVCNGIRYNGMINDYIVTNRFDKEVEISVKNTNCIDECISLSNVSSTNSIMLLNMASEFCPGGGVRKGSTAQEEVICRSTSLLPTIAFHKYPLSPSECIYSPKVFIVKNGLYQNIPHIPISVCSMAALRKPQLNNGKYYSSDKNLMRNKIKMLLQTAHYHQQTTLVLGAWGCGVFSNPESEVAKLFQEELIPYKFAFDKVIFAILEFDPDEPLNTAFKKVFE